MNPLLSKALAAFLLPLFFAYNTPLSLTDAMAEKKISAVFTANLQSTHYEKPITMSLQNLTASPLLLRCKAGLIFHPTDTNFQSIVINQGQDITLAPGQKQDFHLSGFCIRAGKSSPHSPMSYKIGKPATGKLLQLIEFIESKHYFDIAAQHAVWVISNNYSLDGILSFDGTEQKDLIDFFVQKLGYTAPLPPAPDDYTRNLAARPTRKVVGGNFEFNLSRPRAIHAALFNKDNIVVRELYNNPFQPAGNKKINFEFDASVYTDELYYVRLIADGQVMLDRQLRLN